ncbi:MAG TPA: RDD family protein [Pyrinomonadaceae bacterium]|nr:RDD family protein [Pyrinomonadaceae bacterium]
MTDNSNGTNATSQGTNNSTLLEFPGVNRNRPAWRKELSERFREIQQRRAREAALETESQQRPAVRGESEYERPEPTAANNKAAEASKQLGLVPPPEEPEMNPLVVAALRRIERARAQAPTHARQGSGRGQVATAAARVVEEQPEQIAEPAPAVRRDEQAGAQTKRASRRAERADAAAKVEEAQARATTLAVVPPKQSAESATVEATKAPAPVEEKVVATQAAASVETKSAAAVKTKAAAEATTPAAAKVEVEKQNAASAPTSPATNAESQPPPAGMRAHAEAEAESQAQTASRQPRKIEGVLDEFWLERQGLDPLPKISAPELSYDDRAPRAKRIAAAVVDLVAVAFLCAPFAAAIELTIGNWSDPHVYGSMAGIVVGVMFLYHTCSVALAGHTWGMALCSLRAVDSRTALVPTTGQCARRALAYILSLATLGLGIIYSVFDAEGRTAHDLISGTVVVRQ